MSVIEWIIVIFVVLVAFVIIYNMFMGKPDVGAGKSNAMGYTSAHGYCPNMGACTDCDVCEGD